MYGIHAATRRHAYALAAPRRARYADQIRRHSKREILALPEAERQALARELLPELLLTRPGLAQIGEALDALSDEELDGLVERARARARGLFEDTVAAVIAEGLKAARASGRS